MIEFNMNTGIPTAGVPVSADGQTTNMSNQYVYDSPINYQNQQQYGPYNYQSPYGYQNPYGYESYNSYQPYNGQMGMYGQQMPYGTPQNQYASPYGYNTIQYESSYGYNTGFNQPYSIPAYGYEAQYAYGQQQLNTNNPYMSQPMYYQQQQYAEPTQGFFDIPQTNDFLRDGNVQQYIREHDLDLTNPDHFELAKQFARSIGILNGDQPVHQPGIKTWEFMRKPRPEMMPTDPNMDPRTGYMGVGGIGYNNPNLGAIPYNGGQPIYQQNGYGGIPQPQPVPDQIVHVDGFKMPGSQFLIPADIEERIGKLQAEMMTEIEEENVKRAKKSVGTFNANPYSFYGYNTFTWEHQRIIQKYYRKIDELVEECRQKRSNLNKRLVKLCRRYAGEDITDEEIDQLFAGHDYVIPGTKIQVPDNYAYLYNMVPVDNMPNPYYLHALERRKLFEQIYGPDVKGNDKFLKNTSLIDDYYQMEESRRNRLSYGTNGMFNGDQYLHQLRRHIAERLATDKEYRGYGAENTREKINIFDQSLYSAPTQYKEPPVPNDVEFKSPKDLISIEEPENKNHFKVMQNKDGSLELSPPDWMIESVLGKEALAKQMLEDSYNERKVAFYQALHDDGGD